MKSNKLLAAGILTLALTSCVTLASCSRSNTNSLTTSGNNVITSTTNNGSNAGASVVTPSTSTDVEAFVTKTVSAISYEAYQDSFTLTNNSDSSAITGSNNVYTIKSAGTYTLSGNLENGRVEVKKGTGVVTLILNNVSISGIDAAIWIKKNNTVTITATDDSKNYFKDGSVANFEAAFISEEDDEPKGTIFSKSPLTINGSGAIYVISSATDVPYTEVGESQTLESINGIHVKDNLTIDSTNLYIDSVNDGIKNKGELSISNSTLEIKALDDGIASDYDEDVTEDNETGVITLENNNIIISSTHDGIQAEYGVISSSGEYYITAGTNGSSGTEDEDSHKGIKASFDDDTTTTLISTIQISGGTYYIDSLDDAIHSDDNITLTGGKFVIKTQDDGVHADSDLVIEGTGPSITILKSYEGLEGLDITIDSGFIYIVSEDDGINAAGGNDNNSTPGNNPGGHWGIGGGGPNAGTTDGAVITINGGQVIVNASGDGIDSNGNVYITGGTTIVNANVSGDNTALDFDGSCQISGGIFIAAGSSGMLEYPSSSSQKVLCATSSRTNSSSTYYGIFDSSSNLVAAFTSTYNTSSLFFSSPSLSSSGSYTVRGGGSYAGGTDSYFGYSTGGTYTGGTALNISNR